MNCFLLFVLMLLIPLQAIAQSPSPQDAPAYVKASSNTELPVRDQPLLSQASAWMDIEIVLSVGVLLFSFVVLILEALIVIRAKKAWAAQSILQLFGLTLILCMSVLLIIAGYNQEQIAPVMALLGVVAGYLLGNNERPQGRG
jgi:hypothetical protein